MIYTKPAVLAVIAIWALAGVPAVPAMETNCSAGILAKSINVSVNGTSEITISTTEQCTYGCNEAAGECNPAPHERYIYLLAFIGVIAVIIYGVSRSR